MPAVPETFEGFGDAFSPKARLSAKKKSTKKSTKKAGGGVNSGSNQQKRASTKKVKRTGGGVNSGSNQQKRASTKKVRTSSAGKAGKKIASVKKGSTKAGAAAATKKQGSKKSSGRTPSVRVPSHATKVIRPPQPRLKPIQDLDEYRRTYSEYLHLHRLLPKRQMKLCYLWDLIQVAVGSVCLLLDMWLIISLITLIQDSTGEGSIGGTVFCCGAICVYSCFAMCFVAAYEDEGGYIINKSSGYAEECKTYTCFGGSNGKCCFRGLWSREKNTRRVLFMWAGIKIFLVVMPVVFFVVYLQMEVEIDEDEECDPVGYGFGLTDSEKNEKWLIEQDEWRSNRVEFERLTPGGGLSGVISDIKNILQNDRSAPVCTTEKKTANLLYKCAIVVFTTLLGLAINVLEWIWCCATYPKRSSKWKELKPRLLDYEARCPNPNQHNRMPTMEAEAEGDARFTTLRYISPVKNGDLWQGANAFAKSVYNV